MLAPLSAIHTFEGPQNSADLKAANALQDAIRVDQRGGPGRFEIPNWDEGSQAEVRKLVAALDARNGLTTEVRMGTREEVDPIYHLLATATAAPVEQKKRPAGASRRGVPLRSRRVAPAPVQNRYSTDAV